MSSYPIRVSVSPEVWSATDWHRLWRSIVGTQKVWRTLALVPGGPGAPASTCLQIAAALAETGTNFLGTPVHVANATELAPAQVPQFSKELKEHMGQRGMMIIALSALTQNPSSLQLAKEADCALLCIVLGEISNPEARSTLAQVGASRFVGSAVFHLPARPLTPQVGRS
jgi:hypothetical protein